MVAQLVFWGYVYCPFCHQGTLRFSMGSLVGCIACKVLETVLLKLSCFTSSFTASFAGVLPSCLVVLGMLFGFFLRCSGAELPPWGRHVAAPVQKTLQWTGPTRIDGIPICAHDAERR